MNKTTILIGSALLFLLGGCMQSDGFKKTKSGLLYKIISDEKNPPAKKGEILKVNYIQYVGDSVMYSSYENLPAYAPVDSVGPVYNPAEIFLGLRNGDSAIVVMMADTFLNKQQGQAPPTFKKGDKLKLVLKVLDVFKSDEEVKKDQETLKAGRKITEIEYIRKYLNEKNIKAEKTEKGVFVVVADKGTGPLLDSGKVAHVKYKGYTFDGKVFDSNLDSTFRHTDPFKLAIGKGGAIEGWDDGMRMFAKGGKGTLYIPSMLAYGSNPPPGSPFKPFENLAFDIEVVDVTEQKDEEAKMRELQKKAGQAMPPVPNGSQR